MKPFTILEENKQKLQKNNLLEIINETVNIEIKGNPDKFVKKSLQINGKEQLVKEIDNFFKNQRKQTKKIVRENLRKQFFHNIDLNKINEHIKYLTENLERSIKIGIPDPCDIFSSEDYEIQDKIIVELKSLNNIPDEYKDYLTIPDIEKYFDAEEENVVEIIFTSEKEMRWSSGKNGTWKLNFDTKGWHDTYIEWVKEHKTFIAGFIEATVNLIGSENLKLDKELMKLL